MRKIWFPVVISAAALLALPSVSAAQRGGMRGGRPGGMRRGMPSGMRGAMPRGTSGMHTMRGSLMGNGRINMNRFFDPRFRRFDRDFDRFDRRVFNDGFIDPRFNGGLFNTRSNRLFVDPRFNGGLFNSRFNLGLLDPRLILGIVQGLVLPF